MKKHTICSAAIQILEKSAKPMTADEIYEFIKMEGFYEFKAKEPKSILKSTLRKHTEGMSKNPRKGTTYFKINENGKYQLLK